MSDPIAPTPDDATPQQPLPPGAMRLSDTERNSAISALGEHLAAGRISLDEYGDRSARVAVAKTADDLSELFDDLPDPHPALPGSTLPGALPTTSPGFPGASGGTPSAWPPPSQPAVAADNRSTAQKIVGAAAAASVFVALVLFFITGWWYWFLLIPAISAIAGSIWGPDWKDSGGRNSRRRVRGDRRRQLGS